MLHAKEGKKASVVEDKTSLVGSKKSKARKAIRDKIASELFKGEEGNTTILSLNMLILHFFIS